ncbi:uncharacterized protein LOC114528834 isoform X2 [Dendronephthya gigantea]|uniref:uncharacterized protein LOC114528834 isoform X2 n=1 Tax=Dendronephthya gigantea TaxID=151771 RepID=UPI0010698E31|nr:uncharacterized protein LOC114528834 isoform X2 [Dendronephthya gigantea]
MTRKSPVNLKSFFLLLLCFVLFTVIYYNAGFSYESLQFWKTLSRSKEMELGASLSEWTSSTIQETKEQCASITKDKVQPLPSEIGCRIPFMDAFHPQIMKYVSSSASPKCSGQRYGELVDGALHFRDPKVKSATYQAISRNGETSYTLSASKPVVSGQKINDQLIEVDFTLDNNQHAKELHLHAVPNENVLKREAKTNSGVPLNILVIGLDSVSHGSAQRKLPRVYKFLRDELGAYFFNGHVVTGDGTVEQMAPMLTGRKFMEELYEARPDRAKSRTVDDWPWIYKQLKEHGYITGYNEDGTHLGPFNWRLRGFSSPPTDFYPIPFFRRTKKLMKGGDQCVGAKNVNQYQYDYIRSFFKVFSKKLKFLLSFTAGYSHHELTRVQKLERDLLVLLKDLNASNVFDNTMFILMGDHGVRWGSVRETIQGKLEERMPFFSIAFPRWFKSKFPKIDENLRTNVNRLTTWYDVYATLRHMLSYPDLPKDIKHGQSLFTEIPISRTCKDAFVPNFWCPCLRWSAVDTKHTHAQKAALVAIEWMNMLTGNNNSDASQCQVLTLKKVTSALLERPNDLVLRFKHVDLSYTPRYRPQNNPPQTYFCRYQVQFVTAPNNATYVVQAKFYKKKFTINTKITRIDNDPGPQCTANAELRKYCACK